MKKSIVMTLTAALLLFTIAGCGGDKNNEQGADGDNGPSGPINVISREDGSGTRGAFIELFGIEEKGADGKKIDNTIDSAEITNNTSVMMTTVAGDTSAIGYISLGSLNDSVKGLKIDGVAPSAETVKDGSYAISRPFNIATKGDLSPLAKDFMAFILSKEGQDVVEKKGYIRVDDTGAFTGTKPAGKVVIGGSSSVTPVMEALAEAYKGVNPDADLIIQATDSTTGMNAVLEGICEIGMASRALKDSERSGGLTPTVIALDGIVVAVNTKNPVEGLTRDQVKEIYTGVLTEWAEVK